MPRIVRMRFQWKSGEEPYTRDLTFYAPEADAVSKLVEAINEDVIPTLGEELQISINTKSEGNLRDAST